MFNQRGCITLFITLFILNACTTHKTSLKEAITSELSKVQGSFAVAFVNLATGEKLFINESESFHAASTMKTPVLIEVYKQAAAGQFSLQDSLVLKNEFKSIVDSSLFQLNPDDDSDKELYKHIGEKRTIAALVYDMIIVSSNLATNTVIELVNAKKVTETMRGLGAANIQVLRGVEDSKAFRKGLSNTITAADLAVIFEKMANGAIIDTVACQSMISILLDQRFNEIIPAQLPPAVKVAHKTGNITGVNHDSGIVFLPDGRKYVLVLLSKKTTDERAAIKAMANVSKLIYDYVKAAP
jgi:beta-lactamase class A